MAELSLQYKWYSSYFQFLLWLSVDKSFCGWNLIKFLNRKHLNTQVSATNLWISPKSLQNKVLFSTEPNYVFISCYKTNPFKSDQISTNKMSKSAKFLQKKIVWIWISFYRTKLCKSGSFSPLLCLCSVYTQFLKCRVCSS